MTNYLLMIIIVLLISESFIWDRIWKWAKFAKFRRNWKIDSKRSISKLKDYFKNLFKKDRDNVR